MGCKAASPLKKPAIFCLQQAGSLNLQCFPSCLLPKAVFGRFYSCWLWILDFGGRMLDTGRRISFRHNKPIACTQGLELILRWPRNLSLSATMFAALPRSAKLPLCGLWSCPAARKDIFIVQFDTSQLAHRGWGKVGRKRGQCHWEVGDCLEFEDDFYMATCHKYI